MFIAQKALFAEIMLKMLFIHLFFQNYIDIYIQHKYIQFRTLMFYSLICPFQRAFSHSDISRKYLKSAKGGKLDFNKLKISTRLKFCKTNPYDYMFDTESASKNVLIIPTNVSEPHKPLFSDI